MNPTILKYLTKYGKVYKSKVCPQNIKRGEVGDCFDTCTVNALKTEYYYVEGMARDPRNGEWILHAWLTDVKDKHAYDPTWRNVVEGKEKPVPTEYIGITISIEKLAKFLRESGYKSVIANGWRAPHIAKEMLPSYEKEFIKGEKAPRCEVCKFSLVDSTQAICNCGKYSW